MIRVVYRSEHCGVSVEGHANSGDPGKDLVCAGVSALAYTLAGNVWTLEETGKVRDVYVKLESGAAEISCRPVRKYEAIVSCILRSVCIGFEMLARQYPQYISYEIRG